MNEYNREQLEAHAIVRRHLLEMGPDQRARLRSEIEAYLAFRRRLDAFLSRHFAEVCTHNCFANSRSACCSKEGIITFFADAVVNGLCVASDHMERMMDRLRRPIQGPKCVYLTDSGCMWGVRPIVCAMFLCDQAQETAIDAHPALVKQWETFKEEKKRFTWPDRPVLFDALEARFIAAGYKSPLMYLHFSPGLLRIKKLNLPQHDHEKGF